MPRLPPAAMVLCAGLGSRLRPLTDELPKPLVPIGDRPAASGIVAALRAALPGAPLVVNAHHRAASVRLWAEAEGVAVSEEQDLLGTAGGVAAASPWLSPGGRTDADVLVWNGDILCDLDPAALLERHASGGAAATLAVSPRPAGEGNVGLDGRGRIVRLRQERFGEEVRGGAFLGIHVLGPRLRAGLPVTGCLVGDVYLPLLRGRELELMGHETDAAFLDVGTIAAYLEANARWLARHGLASFVHPEADVAAGVDVRGSVVGSGARVRADATGAVIWPGAAVDAPVSCAVVTPRAVAR